MPGIAINLLLASSLQAAQPVTIAFSRHFTLIMLPMSAALWHGVRAGCWAMRQRRERVLRRWLRDLSVASQGKPQEQP